MIFFLPFFSSHSKRPLRLLTSHFSFVPAGISTKKVSYHSSQPWAFPFSLMIGCIAEANSESFTLDEIEIDEGRWFSRLELKKAIEGNNSNFFVPPSMAIAHHLIKNFVYNE